MKHEYHEGPESKERFEKLASAVFRAPKTIVKPAEKPALLKAMGITVSATSRK